MSATALDSLCRVDPDQFPIYFAVLRRSLGKMFTKYSTPVSMKRILAERVMQSIGLPLFAQRHYELIFEQSRYRPTDCWFYECLFEGKTPILTLHMDDWKGTYIAWASGNGSGQFPLAPNPVEETRRVMRTHGQPTDVETAEIGAVIEVLEQNFGDVEYEY